MLQALNAQTFSVAIAEAVAGNLERAGYEVNVVYSDKKSANRQAIEEAEFGTDLTFGLYRPEVGLYVDVADLGYHKYFPWLSAGRVLTHAHKALALGCTSNYPEGNEKKAVLAGARMGRAKSTWVVVCRCA